MYVRAHQKPVTRLLHAIGSVLVLVCLVLAVVHTPLWLLAAPVIGYGFAWTGHFGFEGNKPATFGHPFWSLAADYRMLALTLAGRMAAEVKKHAHSTAAHKPLTAEDP